MKPAISINGITHQVKTAPPVNKKSVRFIADSIAIIEINDIPIAVLNALYNFICLLRMSVSRNIEVIKPFAIASSMILPTGQSDPINWK